MRDAYMDAVSKAMVEAVNTEGYARATGAMLDNTLAVSAPLREAMEKSMLQVLERLSLPSSQDFATLADRFTNLEMRLDDMDAKLDRIEKQTHAASPATDEQPAKSPVQDPKAEAEPPARKKSAAASKPSTQKTSPRKRTSGRKAI